MKKLMFILLLYVIPVFIYAQVPSDTTHHNAVKIGKATLVISVVCFSDSIDSLKTLDEVFDPIEIYASNSPIYNEIGNSILVPMKRDSMRYYAEVPIERLEEIGGIQVHINGNWVFGSPVVLRQDEPSGVHIEMYPSDPSRRYARYYGASKDYSVEDWMVIGDIAMNAVSMDPSLYIPKDRSLYGKSWHAVRNYHHNSALPGFLQECIEDNIIPRKSSVWFMNDLKRIFASQCIIPYTRLAKMVDITVEEPPVESYSFLDSIDYSPDIFLLGYPFMTIRYLLNNILRDIDGGLDDIGERPVAEWKEYMDRKLAPAMKERPKLLLDLLAGMSYVRQLEEEKPLTDVQVRNINEGFTDDIGKIVLARNEALIARLSAKEKAVIKDLASKEAFDLEKFIGDNYKGRPVVVDLWNTWCGPCLSAISQSEEVKQTFAGKDLVFLYVADESSPEEEWRPKAEEIGSRQVRISKEASTALLERYGLEGFPSYLFFDRDHRLVNSRTSFPGAARFQELLTEICE